MGGGRTESPCRICEHFLKCFFESTFISKNGREKKKQNKKTVFEDEALIPRGETWWGCTSITEEIRFLFFPARTNVYKCGAGGVPW